MAESIIDRCAGHARLEGRRVFSPNGQERSALCQQRRQTPVPDGCAAVGVKLPVRGSSVGENPCKRPTTKSAQSPSCCLQSPRTELAKMRTAELDATLQPHGRKDSADCRRFSARIARTKDA